MNHTESIINASISKRFIAGLIDYAIIYTILLLYIEAFGEADIEGNMSVSGMKALPVILGWFILTIGLEQLLGSTIGNGIVGIKPMQENGINPPSAMQSVKRHLLDMIDMFPFGLVGILTMKNTPKKQRLGDLWAKTIVVQINRTA